MLVSIIITTKNSARTLEACLRSVRDQTYRPIEIIVVDNHSADETLAIAKKYADRVLQAGPERCAQRNAGIRESTGEYVCIIDSDMTLQNDVIEKCVAAISRESEAVVIPERSFGVGFWSACKAAERECYLEDENTTGARFFTRRVLDEVGFYDETFIGGEDWDLSIRATNGLKPSFAQSLILHDEGRQSFIGLCRKKFYYGAGLRIFIKKHGADALRRLQPMRPALLRGLARIFRKPLIGAGFVVMKSGELAAVLLGMLLNRQSLPESIYRHSNAARQAD